MTWAYMITTERFDDVGLVKDALGDDFKNGKLYRTARYKSKLWRFETPKRLRNPGAKGRFSNLQPGMAGFTEADNATDDLFVSDLREY